MDSRTWLVEYNPAADENLRATGDTKVLTRNLRQAADEIDRLQELANLYAAEASSSALKLEAQQWIALTAEQLPEKGRVVLCYTPSKNARFKIFSSYRHKDEFQADWSNFWTEVPVHRVTHWKPLPEAPK